MPRGGAAGTDEKSQYTATPFSTPDVGGLDARYRRALDAEAQTAGEPGSQVSFDGKIFMRVAVFSTKSYDQAFIERSNAATGSRHEFVYLEPRLTAATAPLAHGCRAACCFVNDSMTAEVLEILKAGGTDFIALRSAGFNHVDLEAADRIGIEVARVPAYSPHAVAEHAVALVLALNRRIHRAYNRVRDGNFALEGLLGFDLHGKTVGVVGTGKIGRIFARIMHGFGCRVLAVDPYTDAEVEAFAQYVPMDTLLAESDMVALHLPLTPETRHLIDADAVDKMKQGVMLVNTSRGALVDTPAVIGGLKNGKIGYLAIDVYEEEEELFFEDLSGKIITDDVFTRLLTFPNVLVTGHQGFFTEEALTNIAETTVQNLTGFETGEGTVHRVSG
jgi:D-lactate dehydrogenase